MTVRETLRRFNRTYTQRIGALDESFLDSGRALGPARVLFEIGLDGASTLSLRRRLGLDSGYFSRLLRSLEADGLVETRRDPDDGRRRVARLTDDGRRAWRDLDDRSNELADRILTPLSNRQRRQLEDVLAIADRLIRAATVTFDVTDVAEPDARWAIESYFRELDERFETGFDAEAALASDPEALSTFVVMRTDGDPIACGGLAPIDDRTVEIKRMWVASDWRGVGLGLRMLTHLEGRAAGLGYQRIVLDTNPTLTEAISMYERAGYSSAERYNDNPYAGRWFEKLL